MAAQFHKPRFGRGPRFKKPEPYRINERITAPVVRVVGDNVETGIYQIKEAIEIADHAGLDLVEISPKANPPVCKVIDYKKFLYDKKKKEKEIKAKTAKIVVKEIRLGPNTDDHDFNFKLNHAKKFLEDGAKVKVEVFFKGRTIIYKEKGEIMLLKFAQELTEYGKVEKLPKLEGKRMIMIIVPKK
ncbi:MAG: translation initiation factor IF-3 [Bacteroidales bacterium]|nr:translation initiation factor IF-3 [Bacteroidales bacterium]MCF8386843.1 translation initiation factor IF-3 [Bacteroidales bacterium]MCF8399261.1 translation initiation factor IF-3 [Bacteroidales bacterium]